MPMVGMVNSLVTCAARSRGIALEHERERAGVLERMGVGEEPLAVAGAPRLHLHASERVDGLGRQPEVAHHRDPALGQTRDRLDGPPAALELDGVHACLQVLHSVVDGVAARALICAEGEVADEELTGSAPSHGACVVEHLGHRHGEGVGIAEDVVRQCVADEQDRHLSLGEQPGGRVVVGGEHDEALSFGLPSREILDR